MPTVSTVTAVWDGFQGAPGYSRFNFFELADVATCNAAGAAVRAFFFSLNTLLLNNWTVKVNQVVQHKDVATGDLTGETVMSSVPSTVLGVAAAATVWAGGSGLVTNWITGAFWNGRKVRGRTFIVPAVGGYSNDGTISTGTQNQVTNAGNTLIADPTTSLAIWAKKFDSGNPPKQVAGGLFSVTGCATPDRAAQLRTRRS
jgi:hypothetical protein